MFATTSPRAHTRRLSNGSFNSNPDIDIDSNEEHNNYTPGGGGGGLGISGVGVGAGGNGNGLLRPPNAGLGTPSRPPRDSLVRQSLHSYPAPNPPPTYPPLNGGPPRRSFIPPAEYGYYDPPLSRANTRPPTQYRTAQVPATGFQPPLHEPSHDSHSYVTDRMEIAGEREPRTSRLKRFANALLKPLKVVKSVFRVPRYLRIRWRRGSSAVTSPRPITQSSGWDFRDRTPAPTSVGHQISNEDGELRTNVGAGNGNNVTMLFPEPQVSPPPVGSIGHNDGGRGPRSSGGTDSAHGHSVTHHSHSQPHSYAHVSPQDASHRSNHSHLHSRHGDRETIKANVYGGAGVRSSDSHTQSHSSHSRSSRSTQSRFSAFSPVATSRIFAGPPKEDASSRGGRRLSLTTSMKSHYSSLLHQFRLIFEAFQALYHLPWVADPPKRIAADFIPAFGSRSKYRVQEQQRHRRWKDSNGRMEGGGRGWVYPPEVLIAAAAAKNMEPSEGKSWYRPSPAQLERMMKRKGPGSLSTSSTHEHGHGNGHYHAHHGHRRRHGHEQGNYFYNPQTLTNAYQTLFADDVRGRHTQTENQPMFVVGQPLNIPGFGPPPTFPQPFGGATMGPGPGTYYIVPGPPPPFPTAQVAPQVNSSTSQPHQAGTGANANGNANANANGGGLRPPPPTRPPSAVSVSFRQGPGPRAVQNNGTPSNQPQPQPQSGDPNSSTPNPNPSNQNLTINVARPLPVAVAAPTQQQQQMYMLVQAPPLSAPGLAPHPSHLPPSYNSGGGINIYPYPYTPPWTPPSQRM